MCIIIERAQLLKEVYTHTYKHGIKSFKYQGIKILNDLKSMRIYQDATCKSYFMKELKSDLSSSYTTLTANASLLSTCDLILLIFFIIIFLYILNYYA